MMNIKRSVIFLLLLGSAFTSCKKNLDEANWDVDGLTPIFKTSLDINNLLADSLIQKNADNSLKLVYSNRFYNFNVDSLLDVPDTTVRSSFKIPFGSINATPGFQLFNSTSDTKYAADGAALNKLFINSGTLTFLIKSKVEEKTDFTYSIPSATKGGTAFTFSTTVPASDGVNDGVYTGSFDIAGYDFDLTGQYHNTVNAFTTSVQVGINPNGNAVTITPADSIEVFLTFSAVVPSYAKGYFGMQNSSVASTSNFDLFNRIRAGAIGLENTTVTLKLTNGIGVDATAHINSLTSFNTRTNTSVSLVNNIVGAPININRALESPYTPSFYYNVMNSNNSNIKALLENLPDKMSYNIDVAINPNGNISNGNDFVFTDKLIDASLDVEIPLSFFATNLTLIDTVDVSLTEQTEHNRVNSGTLTLKVDNGFPLEASIQLYLLNENGNVYDSLLTSTLVEAAPVDGNLIVTSKKLSKLIIPLNKQKVDKVFATKKILVKTIFNTVSNPQYVKIYSDYTMDLKLIANFNYNIQPK